MSKDRDKWYGHTFLIEFIIKINFIFIRRKQEYDLFSLNLTSNNNKMDQTKFNSDFSKRQKIVISKVLALIKYLCRMFQFRQLFWHMSGIHSKMCMYSLNFFEQHICCSFYITGKVKELIWLVWNTRKIVIVIFLNLAASDHFPRIWLPSFIFPSISETDTVAALAKFGLKE